MASREVASAVLMHWRASVSVETFCLDGLFGRRFKTLLSWLNQVPLETELMIIYSSFSNLFPDGSISFALALA